MRANFIHRLCAYIIDFIIVTLIISFVTSAIPSSKKYDDTQKKLNNLYSDFIDGEITAEKYLSETNKLARAFDRESIIQSGIAIVFAFSYYTVCAYYSEGQTLGKKLMRIKVKQISGKLRFSSMVMRSLLVYGVLTNTLLLGAVFILNGNNYFYFKNGLSIVEGLFIIVCLVMILYTKNKRALHDIITKTEVVKVRGE